VILPITLSVAAGAFLWLDRVFLFQSMISRPIILSPILGFILGDVAVGLIVGASLELLWLNAPPVGAYLPNDETFCAAVATPAAFVAAHFMGDAAAAGLALVACLPVSLIGRTLDTHIRSLNQDLIQSRLDNAEVTVGPAMAKALVRSFLAAFVVMGVSTAFLCMAVYLLGGMLPVPVQAALSFMPSVCILVGLAGLVTKDIPRPSHAALFVAGMSVVLIISWVL